MAAGPGFYPPDRNRLESQCFEVEMAERQSWQEIPTKLSVEEFERHCQLVGSGTDYCEESIAQETVDGF
ncbi:hypothetical protein FSB08_37585 [Paraburkholderia sp. JPY432]|nr:hypothetical protein [Paraburkholderia youngii]